MLPTSPVRRALTPASCDILPARRRAPSIPSARRPMATASAELPMEEHHAPDFHQILDIFDAPARLGESSRLLARSASVRRPAPPIDSSSRKGSSSSVQALPAPIMFDGPSRYCGPKATTNVRGAHSSSAVDSTSPHSLPSPETFDGPSRLRPYAHATTRDSSQTLRSTPSSLLLLGLAGGVGLAGWNHVNSADRERGCVTSSA